MGLICKIKGHDWEKGFCTRCHARHEMNEHVWKNCACCICGVSVFDSLYWARSDQILESIRRDAVEDSQIQLIDIALRLLTAKDKERRASGKKAAALVTDASVLLQRFATWAQWFDEEKCKEEWNSMSPIVPFDAFSNVDEQAKEQMKAIIKPHLINIALNARHMASVRKAMEEVGSLGTLSDEDARRFIPLAENSMYALTAIPMLMDCSPIWKTLLTKSCISALGYKLKASNGNSFEKDNASKLLKDLYSKGCQRDAISRYNGTVMYDAYNAPTDDDNYGFGSHGIIVFRVV